MGAHPGGLFARDTPVEPYGEDLEFWSEARDASRERRLRRAGSSTGCSTRPTRRDYLDRLGPERIARLRRRAEPDSWRDDEAAHPPDLDAPDRRLGAGRGVRGPLPRRPGARHRRRRRPGRCRRRQPGGLAGRRGRPRAGIRRACSPPSSACGGTSRRPPTRSCSTTAASRRATMIGDIDQVLGHAGRGARHHAAGLPGGGADRPARQHQLDRHRRAGRSWSARAAATTWPPAADEVVVMSTLTGRRPVAEVPYVTSPGGAGAGLRHRPRDVREAGRTACSVWSAVAPGDGVARRSRRAPIRAAVPVGPRRGRRPLVELGAARTVRHRAPPPVGPPGPVPAPRRLRRRPSVSRPHPGDGRRAPGGPGQIWPARASVQPGDDVERPGPRPSRCSCAGPRSCRRRCTGHGCPGRPARPGTRWL